MKKTLRFAATLAAAYIIYLFLVFPADSGELILGAAAALISVIILQNYLPFDTRIFNPLRIARGIAYAPYFLWKMIVANIEIAMIVIRPVLRIKPSIVKASTDLDSPEGKLLLTSSITLTPGTLSIDVQGEQLYVHRVKTDHLSEEDTKREVLTPFEKYIKGVTE